MRAIIIAGGCSEAGGGWKEWVGAGDLVVGADGGAAQAMAWGLHPQLVIGDMDSLAEPDRARLAALGCRFVLHPRAKDETDLELALRHALEEGAGEIVILGALGGRLDHLLANVLLLALPALQGVEVRIVEDQEEARLVRRGEAAWLEGQPGDRVSLLPLGGDVHGVTTAGLAWRLDDETLHFGFSRGMSNEMTAPLARIQVREGCLLVVHGRRQGTERAVVDRAR